MLREHSRVSSNEIIADSTATRVCKLSKNCKVSGNGPLGDNSALQHNIYERKIQ